MSDIIKQAIDYADSDEHEGASYRLRIYTASGIYRECDVYGSSMPYVLLTNEHGINVFFNPTQIVCVEIIWR